MILVDSSVWIAAWRGTHPALSQKLSLLVETQQACLNPLIQTELLQGARDEKHLKTLATLLEAVPVLELPEKIWTEAPHLFLKCRKIGLNVTTIDCLLATHTLLEKMPLWSLDGIFLKMTKSCDLKLYGI